MAGIIIPVQTTFIVSFCFMRKLNFQVLQNSIGAVIVDISESFLTILALALRLAAVLWELIEAK